MLFIISGMENEGNKKDEFCNFINVWWCEFWIVSENCNDKVCDRYLKWLMILLEV